MSDGHSYHEGQPGYSPAQVLKDGCGECAERSADVTAAIGSLDQAAFARAWRRAADWNRDGLPDLSEAEMPLLRVLWAVQVQLEARGLPLGECPAGSPLAVFGAITSTNGATA